MRLLSEDVRMETSYISYRPPVDYMHADWERNLCWFLGTSHAVCIWMAGGGSCWFEAACPSISFTHDVWTAMLEAAGLEATGETQHCCSVNTSNAVSLFKMWGLSHLYVASLLTECIGPRRPSVFSRWDYSKKQARGAKECCFPALRRIAADKRRESHSLLGNNMISPKPNLNNLIASSVKLSTQLDWQCKYMNKQFNINSCHKRGLNVGE